MKVAKFDNLAKPLCANPFLKPAPPPQQVKDRAAEPTTKIDGKGSVSFLMPIETAKKANRAGKQPHQHLQKSNTEAGNSNAERWQGRSIRQW